MEYTPPIPPAGVHPVESCYKQGRYAAFNWVNLRLPG